MKTNSYPYIIYPDRVFNMLCPCCLMEWQAECFYESVVSAYFAINEENDYCPFCNTMGYIIEENY